MNMINHILFICFLEAVHCCVNLALNKPAYQKNPFKQNDSTGDASNAVDGQKSDLTRNGGQCVFSAGRETAILWVNLTSIHSIHNITIYYMTDNKQWGPTNYYTGFFLGFSVYVSNSTDRLNGTLCFKDNNFTIETIPAVFTTICPVHGQYVIYYNERLTEETYPDGYRSIAVNNICEIEVYGCPSTGCYGSNNSFPCPDVNCQNCHKETGVCRVCQPGYDGQRCERRNGQTEMLSATKKCDLDDIYCTGTDNINFGVLNSGKTDVLSKILMIVGSITAITVVLVLL